MNTDILIIGAGPAGIFTAMELLRRGSRKKILLVEKGRAVEERRCPKAQTGRCMNCKPYCHITTGFSGAGAFSDGKLSLSTEVGGDLPQLIGDDLAQSLIDYTDSIYLEFGADEHVEGVSEKDAVKEIRKRAIQTGLKLVDCPIRHLGTEKAQEIYAAIEQHLLKNGVEIRFGCACTDLIIRDGVCLGAPFRRAATRTRSTPGTRSSLPAAAARTGSTSSARATTSPTRPAPSTSACASRCATRSWRPSTTCSMNRS